MGEVDNNYYDILGVDHRARQYALDQRLRELLEKVAFDNPESASYAHKHQDYFPYKFAYDILSDPQQRAEHDRKIASGEKINALRTIFIAFEEYLEKTIINEIPYIEDLDDYSESDTADSAYYESVAPTAEKTVEPKPKTLTPDEDAYSFGGYAQTEVNMDSYSWAARAYNGIAEKLKMPVLHLGKIASYLLLYLALNVIGFGLYSLRGSYGLWVFPLAIFQLVIIIRVIRTSRISINKRITVYSGIFTGITSLLAWTSKSTSDPDSVPIWITIFLVLTFLTGIKTTKYLHAGRSGRYVNKFPKKDILKGFQWGTTGDFSSAVGKFTEENIKKGAAGEGYTEQLLTHFKTVPGARVFHGLKFLGTDSSDVDHAILSGNNLIFIDSKQWSKGDYGWDEEGVIKQITLAGKEITRESNFAEAVKRYRLIIPSHINIHAVIVLHGTGITVSEPNKPSTPWMKMYDTQDGLDFIGSLVTQNVTGDIDVRTFDTLRKNLL